MEKILNILKYNTYGSDLMINKYIYMKRCYNNFISYYIYHIDSIKNNQFPIIYNCNRGFELTYDNKKPLYVNEFKQIELINNDILYEINIDEFLGIFKSFVEYEGKNIKISENIFEK